MWDMCRREKKHRRNVVQAKLDLRGPPNKIRANLAGVNSWIFMLKNNKINFVVWTSGRICCVPGFRVQKVEPLFLEKSDFLERKKIKFCPLLDSLGSRFDWSMKTAKG
jgi:hypothetical protein